MGPGKSDLTSAGSGKSTFCKSIMTQAQTTGRTLHLVNLDPAAEHFEYKPSIDIRDLVSLSDVQEELRLGPNGGLIFCLEYLLSNISWLEDQLDDYQDDYLIIDCPGQIELYTHFPIMRQIVNSFSRLGYRSCGIYLLDSQFILDSSKYLGGVLTAMSAMLQLEIPHINVMSKMDLLGDADIDGFLDPDPLLLLEDINTKTKPRVHALNTALVQLIEEFNLVSFIPLNIEDEDSIGLVLSHMDNAVQYGEDVEPKEPRDFFDPEDDE